MPPFADFHFLRFAELAEGYFERQLTPGASRFQPAHFRLSRDFAIIFADFHAATFE